MTKRKAIKRAQPPSQPSLTYSLLVLVFGLSLHSCGDIPAKGVKAKLHANLQMPR